VNAGRDACNLDLLLQWIDGLPTINFAQVAPPEMRRRMALDALKNEVDFRGAHYTAVDKLVAFEIERQTALLEVCAANDKRLLEKQVAGRPGNPAVRDILLFVLQRSLQAAGLKIRPARKLAAQMFGLNRGTRFIKTTKPSVEQVRRPEEHTLRRFALLEKERGGAGLVNLAQYQAACVLRWFFYSSELSCALLGAEALHADAKCLVLLCRTLEVFERSDRMRKAASRKAAKHTARQPAKVGAQRAR
jgi:hypothetical protein